MFFLFIIWIVDSYKKNIYRKFKKFNRLKWQTHTPHRPNKKVSFLCVTFFSYVMFRTLWFVHYGLCVYFLRVLLYVGIIFPCFKKKKLFVFSQKDNSEPFELIDVEASYFSPGSITEISYLFFCCEILKIAVWKKYCEIFNLTVFWLKHINKETIFAK